MVHTYGLIWARHRELRRDINQMAMIQTYADTVWRRAVHTCKCYANMQYMHANQTHTEILQAYRTRTLSVSEHDVCTCIYALHLNSPRCICESVLLSVQLCSQHLLLHSFLPHLLPPLPSFRRPGALPGMPADSDLITTY